MRVPFRPEAVFEVLDAQRWYEARSPGLGFEFARSVEVAIATVLAIRMRIQPSKWIAVACCFADSRIRWSIAPAPKNCW